MRVRTLSVALTAAAMAVTPAAAQAKTIIGSGSSVAEPYLRALFAGYHHVKPHNHFVYTADGGNAGVKDVQQGRSQFAVNTRPPLPSDSGTVYTKLFMDGLCIDVNSANQLTNLSLGSLGDVFLGNVANWTQVPGSGLNTTIDPVGRDSTAGTYTFFQSAVLNGKTQSSKVNPVGSDGLVANAVAHDANAIGYVGYAHSRGANLKPISVDGVACKPANVRSEAYPLSRYIWLVTSGAHPSKAVAKFASWVRRSYTAGRILKKAGAVPKFNRTHK